MRSSVLLALIVAPAFAYAQTPPAGPQFDVVSIKRNTSVGGGGGGRTLPDGTQRMINMPIRNFILGASPVPTREVTGLPDWATTERYDIELKPPPGSTIDQRKQMLQAMFADRMKLVAHVEQHERDVFMMTVARSDGRLGPELKVSPNDCSPPAPGTPPPPQPAPRTGPPTAQDVLGRCGMMMMQGQIISGGMQLANLAISLRGLVDGEVEDHTGLDGFYAFTLRFSPQRPGGVPLDANATDDLPDIFTAVREQLGVKLQREKKMMPVFVVDHIERPTEN